MCRFLGRLDDEYIHANPLAAPLCAAWPKAFTNGSKPKPLKVGTQLDILSSGRFEAEPVSKA